MREYYARLFREVRAHVFIFWKGQIAGGMVAGVITAIVNGINGAATSKVVWESISAVVLGYLALFVIGTAYRAIRAPADLDKKRAEEIDLLVRQHSQQVSAKDAVIAQHTKSIAERNAALSAKHPHDEHREDQVKNALARLEQRERDFISWLLDVGEATNYNVQTAGFKDVATAVLDKTDLVKYTPVKTGNGIWESDRIHHINSAYLDALRNVLHPPTRPVTPPQA